jgi:hypothetical protein
MPGAAGAKDNRCQPRSSADDFIVALSRKWLFKGISKSPIFAIDRRPENRLKQTILDLNTYN